MSDDIFDFDIDAELAQAEEKAAQKVKELPEILEDGGGLRRLQDLIAIVNKEPLRRFFYAQNPSCRQKKPVSGGPTLK